MAKKVKKIGAPPPYYPNLVADWLYKVDPMTLKDEARSNLINACGFFVARVEKRR